ncbi:MAG: hypothetical protein H6603_01560 [Flavobacteriales bacterium]|nr:hypothetical protein [Flavobacteriales bacterium]MCB9191705.1 hypothetical protein [Flavobacteriales bacterium]MCB9203637.1 hypothetical protein [Flavobacteriales bacterium]
MGFSPSDRFPLTIGSLVLLGMIMLFITALVGIYLWYDLRLEQLDQSLQLLQK